MSQTLMLFDVEQSLPDRSKFHGETFDAELDYARLGKQERAVFEAMRGGDWMSLQQLQDRTIWAHPPDGYGQASLSARIRSLRAHGFTIEKRRKGDPKAGLWIYRLVTSDEVGG